MTKTKLLFYLIFSIISQITIGQTNSLVKYTFSTGVYDTLSPVGFDTSISQENTPFFYGIDSLIEILPQTLPTQNTFQASDFSKKQKAASVFDLNKYPLRAAIKIFEENDDTLSDNCSGMMVSKNHVLTSTHCFVNLISDSINSDSILVCPAYNNGQFNTNFNCSYAKAVYYLAGWSIGGEDIAILELNDSIGQETGWISMGFNKVDSLVTKGVFFKFCYPAFYFPSIDPVAYNGDTLYYNYGEVSSPTNSFLQIISATGVPGESGSSLIKIINDSTYTSYGTLSFSTNLRHSRIDNYEYFAFKKIIEGSTVISHLKESESLSFKVFPNPTNGSVTFHSSGTFLMDEIKVYSIAGKLLLSEQSVKLPYRLNLSQLTKGLYFVALRSGNRRETLRIIKQ